MPDRNHAAGTAAASPSGGVLNRFLDGLERVGNRLPDQVTIFVGLCVVTLIVSWWAATSGLAITHPVDGKPIEPANLLDKNGIQYILGSAVTNFTKFPPLGTVLVALIGVGVAERSGLFSTLLKAMVLAVPRWAVTPTIVFAGIMSHVAADAGYIILPPLAAMIFVSLGRHPLAGVAAAVAGIGGGFSANLLLTTLDPLLSGLTETAAQSYDPAYRVNAACNYYFMAASTVLLTLVGWFVSDRLVEPRLGPWINESSAPAPAALERITRLEARGLIAAAAACVLVAALTAWLVIPENAVLRDSTAAGIRQFNPFFVSVVALLTVFFLIPGLAYGITVGNVRSTRDASRMMSETMAAMAQFLVIAFFAGQFIAWFDYSKLGLILAVKTAEFLKTIHLTGLPLLIGLVLFTATVDLFMASASAKWTLLAPVFVPMMMMLGDSPESVQAFYRVGDSVANIVTPLNYYFPIVLLALHRFVPKAGLGTLIAALVDHSGRLCGLECPTLSRLRFGLRAFRPASFVGMIH